MSARRCVLATSPDVVGVTGEYFEKDTVAKLNPEALDEAVVERLWNLSEEAVGL